MFVFIASGGCVSILAKFIMTGINNNCRSQKITEHLNNTEIQTSTGYF